MARQPWWRCALLGTPTLLSRLTMDEDYETEREMTWSELFFDLIFVTGVRRLGEMMREGVRLEAGAEAEDAADDPNAALTMPEFTLYFALLWALWVQQSNYGTRWGANDLFNKMFFGLYMLGVVGTVCNLSPLHSRRNQWAMCSLAVSAFMSLLAHLRIACCFPNERRGRYGIVNSTHGLLALIVCVWAALTRPESYLATMLVVSSLPWVHVLALGVFDPCIFQWPDMHEGKLRPWRERFGFNIPYHLEHYTERVSLLIVIYLGDGVDNLTSAYVDRSSWLKVVLGFFVLLCLKFLLFDVCEMDADRHALRRHRLTAIPWFFVQPMQAFGLSFVGSGLAFLLSADIEVQHEGRWLMCYGVTVVLITFLAGKLLHEPAFTFVGNKCPTALKLMRTLRALHYTQVGLNLLTISACLMLTYLQFFEETRPAALLACLVVLLGAMFGVNYLDSIVEDELREVERHKADAQREKEKRILHESAEGRAVEELLKGLRQALRAKPELVLEVDESLAEFRSVAAKTDNELTEPLLGQGMHAPPTVYNDPS